MIRERPPERLFASHACGSLLLYADLVATDETLRALEHEMGVLVRRIRRVIAERARMLHPDLSPVAYSMMIALRDSGPQRASALVEIFSIDKGAVSRQVQHLTDLGLAERAPDPEDGRASLISASDDAVRRLADVSEHRRKALDERLGQWSDQELTDLVRMLGRYNATLE